MQGVYCVGLYVSDAHSKSIVLVSQSVCLSVCLLFFLYVCLSNSLYVMFQGVYFVSFCQFRMHHASERGKKAKGVDC